MWAESGRVDFRDTPPNKPALVWKVCVSHQQIQLHSLPLPALFPLGSSHEHREETSDSVRLSRNQFNKTTIIFKVKWNKLMQKLHQLGTATHLAVPSCLTHRTIPTENGRSYL